MNKTLPIEISQSRRKFANASFAMSKGTPVVTVDSKGTQAGSQVEKEYKGILTVSHQNEQDEIVLNIEPGHAAEKSETEALQSDFAMLSDLGMLTITMPMSEFYAIMPKEIID